MSEGEVAETYETWQGRPIAIAEAMDAIIGGLRQIAQRKGPRVELESLIDYLLALPDGHERVVDLARWCITDGVLALGAEATRYVEQLGENRSSNAYDLLLAQVINAQRRLNGPLAAQERGQGQAA
jgi:hypothetical protein